MEGLGPGFTLRAGPRGLLVLVSLHVREGDIAGQRDQRKREQREFQLPSHQRFPAALHLGFMEGALLRGPPLLPPCKCGGSRPAQSCFKK